MRSLVTTLALLAACESDYELLVEDLPLPPPPPELQEDVFVQLASTQSDVLFVVDNSGSMASHQQRLADNAPRLFQHVVDSGVDYHVGVVTTDVDDPVEAGRLQVRQGSFWIQPRTPDQAARFGQMVALGVEGSIHESGRAATFAALQPRDDGFNAGFLRDDASLHVIVVSDEDDASGTRPISRSAFVDYLRGRKRDPHVTTFSSIVGPRREAGSCALSPGEEYLQVTRQVGGAKLSICEDDWAPLMDELGELVTGLRRSVVLSRRPVPDTIVVQMEQGAGVQTFPAPSDAWAYEEAATRVVFLGEEPPPSGSIIRVHYEVAVTPPG